MRLKVIVSKIQRRDHQRILQVIIATPSLLGRIREGSHHPPGEKNLDLLVSARIRV